MMKPNASGSFVIFVAENREALCCSALTRGHVRQRQSNNNRGARWASPDLQFSLEQPHALTHGRQAHAFRRSGWNSLALVRNFKCEYAAVTRSQDCCRAAVGMAMNVGEGFLQDAEYSQFHIKSCLVQFAGGVHGYRDRSEERRVGKECRSGWWA